MCIRRTILIQLRLSVYRALFLFTILQAHLWKSLEDSNIILQLAAKQH